VIKIANGLYDNFNLCDDEACALFARIDAMIDTVKTAAPDSITLVKLRYAKRSCEKMMMTLIEAKESMK
jgi:hypothetical protein